MIVQGLARKEKWKSSGTCRLYLCHDSSPNRTSFNRECISFRLLLPQLHPHPQDGLRVKQKSQSHTSTQPTELWMDYNYFTLADETNMIHSEEKAKFMSPRASASCFLPHESNGTGEAQVSQGFFPSEAVRRGRIRMNDVDL